MAACGRRLIRSLLLAGAVGVLTTGIVWAQRATAPPNIVIILAETIENIRAILRLA